MLNTPTLHSSDNFHVYMDNDLTLNCTLTIERGVPAALSWVLPGGAKAWEEQRVEVTNMTVPHPRGVNMQMLISILRVSRVNNATDRGKYQCIATNFHNTTSSKRMVNVIGEFYSCTLWTQWP